MPWNQARIIGWHTLKNVFRGIPAYIRLPNFLELHPVLSPSSCHQMIDWTAAPREHWSADRGDGGNKACPRLSHGQTNLPFDDTEIYHIPVLAKEVLHWLAPKAGMLILDGTFGGGGHARHVLASGANVLALDRDADAMAQAVELEEEYPDNLVAMRTTFDRYPEILSTAGVEKVDAILLDIGVSSWQIDSPNRGFSWRFDGPLDMRMDRDSPLTAAEIVNQWPEKEIAQILWEYGEERASRRIAAAIVKRRVIKPVTTTSDLADLVASVIPKHGPAHVAGLTFQALRIAVNDELGCLERALDRAHNHLKKGGRLVVITFHSLEDRIVKNHFRKHSMAEIDRPEWPAPRANPDHCFTLPIRKAITASEEELASNPRARSAKLRIAVRI